MRTTAECHQHFDFLNELGKAVALPGPSTNRTFLFTIIRIAHSSSSKPVCGAFVYQTSGIMAVKTSSTGISMARAKPTALGTTQYGETESNGLLGDDSL
jgi:hypothetical protein